MSIQANLNQGLEYLKSDRIDEAIEIFENATKLAPQDYRLFNYLGAAYAKKGKHNLAIGAFQTASHLGPDIASIRYNLGLAYQADGINDMAMEQFRQALQIDPNYAPAEEALRSLEQKTNSEDIYSGLSCARHPDEPAVGICSLCRLPVCAKCRVVIDGEVFCKNCKPTP
jgi:tetratricopeptide (TPR) repeat protein